ncbi:putative small intestine urate exporter [Crocuta crocuta]
MSSRAEAKAAGDISSDRNFNMAQAQTSRKGFCSVRHGLALIMHLCNVSVGTQKMNLSVALPAMVNSTALAGSPNTSMETPPTASQDRWNETLKEFKPVAPMYDWSPETQGIILSSLNYGSFLAPIPVGYVSVVFGAKYLVGVGLLLSSVLTFFIPLAADAGVDLLIVIRSIQGIAQSMVLTSQYSVWVKWAPPLEKSQLINIAISGQMLGLFIIFLVGGLLCQTIGWPYVFYIFGGFGCICSFLWFPLVYDDPIHHPFISAGEKEYIVRSLAQQDCSRAWSLPIKAMIRSLPVWAILVFHFTEFWTFHTFMDYLPTYFSTILQANLRDIGILTSLLVGTTFICTILEGLLADFLLSRKLLTLTAIRKLSSAIGVLIPSAVLMCLHWVRSSMSVTMALLVLCHAAISFCQTGALINLLDIAPRYTGFLKGLSQIFVYLSGAISPAVTGFIISQDAEFGWRNIFLISASMNLLGLVFYLIFSQAEVQDWATEQTLTQF